jgi:hypothetical protein
MGQAIPGCLFGEVAAFDCGEWPATMYSSCDDTRIGCLDLDALCKLFLTYPTTGLKLLQGSFHAAYYKLQTQVGSYRDNNNNE